MKQPLRRLPAIILGLGFALGACTRPDPPAPIKTVPAPVAANRSAEIETMLIEAPPSLPTLVLSATDHLCRERVLQDFFSPPGSGTGCPCQARPGGQGR